MQMLMFEFLLEKEIQQAKQQKQYKHIQILPKNEEHF
jgi:hypothetical protein